MTSESWSKNHFPEKCPSFLRNTISELFSFQPCWVKTIISNQCKMFFKGDFDLKIEKLSSENVQDD
jgi:hypothetical protein